MNMEVNKIFAAFLVAGIVGMLCWFISHESYEREPLEKNAYEIAAATSSDTSGAPAAEAKAEPIDVSKGDLALGAKISAVCSSCHSLGKGEPAKIGPNLFGVVGGPHAHMAGYSYSDAMKSHASEKWTEAALNEFLWNPQKTIPGTKMTFMGLKKPEERAAIIHWLETQK